MTNVAIGLTIDHSLPDGQHKVSAKNLSDPNGTAPVFTTVDTNIATLVADGATPTQAHVNTLNTNWSTLKTSMTAYANTVGALTNHAHFLYDPAQLTTMNKVRAVLRALELQLRGAVKDN